MKKHVIFLIATVLLATAAYAQTPAQAPSHAGRFYVSVQGGPTLSLYENAFSYRDNGCSMDLIKSQGALALGYDWTDVYGARLQVAFGGDAGAGNVRETSAGGFYPYTFNHINMFADAVLNLNGLSGKSTATRAKLFAGIGGANTYGFTDPNHPWQGISKQNTVFGFRLGGIVEYTFTSGIGIFTELCGEAYTDMYNGLMPSKQEQESYEGYGGFPLDLRGILSLGLVYHF